MRIPTRCAQSIVEYTLIFIAFTLAVGIFIVKTQQGFEAHFQKAATEIVK